VKIRCMNQAPLLPGLAAKQSYKQGVLAQIRDTLRPIAYLLNDESVNEIMVNAPHDVFVAQRGRKQRVNVELSAGAINAAITLLAAMVEREIGARTNRRVLSARLPGFRIEAVLPPVAVNGPSMCIRRHAARVISLQEYVSSGVLSEHHRQVIEKAVHNRQTMLIVGGTGSGKTTLVNAILAAISPEERLFVIESVHELQMTAPNHVLVECDEDAGVTPRTAVRTAMRYLPDRIIVGELRGPEAQDWLDAANTGHPGSAATIHANSASRALPRLENLVLMAATGMPHEAIRTSIAETVNLMVYVEHRNSKRQVSEVTRLHGYDRATQQYQLEAL
jgi:pilus assembly protein CpaF